MFFRITSPNDKSKIWLYHILLLLWDWGYPPTQSFYIKLLVSYSKNCEIAN